MAMIDVYKLGKIGVLMGGPSTEREISLKSGTAVYESLKNAGVNALAIDIQTDDIETNINLIKAKNLDCAFIALHGRFGEDGQMQEILDNLAIPYTGSGVTASKLAMDKTASRKIFVTKGLAVPAYQAIDKTCVGPDYNINLNFPLVVKPATHGSSIGLSIIDNKEDLDKAIKVAFGYDARIIIEEYIPGREVTVGILDEQALPVIEIIPKKKFFDYEAKYTVGMTNYVVPAKLEEVLAKQIQAAGLASHQALGCFGFSRVDMILSQDNIPVILEVNTIPGLTSTSLLPKAAKVVGISFLDLCLKLIELAYEKATIKTPKDSRLKV